MPLSARRFVIRHDSETTYNSGGDPASAAKALLAFEATPPQLQADKKTRPFVAPFFGARPFLLAQQRWQFPFMIEAQGSGTAGTRPPMANLFLDGGLTETTKTTTAKVASAAKASGAPVGTFTYTVANGGSAKVMRTVTLTCTTGGASGTAAFTVSAPATGRGACAENAYNQTAVVMTDGETFDLANGAQITPTVGTNFTSGDVYTIEIGPSRVEYSPSSDKENHDSGVIHWHEDTIKMVSTGSRCDINMDLGVDDFPRFGFQYQGLYAQPTKVALPGVDYSAFKDPELVSNDNTWLVQLHGYTVVMKSFAMGLGNAVALKHRVGRREIGIGDRQVTGTMVIEATDLDAKNYFAAVDSLTRGDLRLCHGLTPGKIFEVRGDAVQLDPIKINSDADDAMFEIGLTFCPYDTSVGDDEFKWLFY